MRPVRTEINHVHWISAMFSSFDILESLRIEIYGQQQFANPMLRGKGPNATVRTVTHAYFSPLSPLGGLLSLQALKRVSSLHKFWYLEITNS